MSKRGGVRKRDVGSERNGNVEEGKKKESVEGRRTSGGGEDVENVEEYGCHMMWRKWHNGRERTRRRLDPTSK